MREKQIKISDFTKAELDYYIERCNFTAIEEELFRLRSKYYTLENAAEMMNISSKTAYRVNKRIKRKIVKVCKETHLAKYRRKPCEIEAIEFKRSN